MATLNRSALSRKTSTSLLNKIKESNTKKDYNNEDDRFWQPTVDTNGNGMAVIRFLPAKHEESLPYIKQYSQGFKVGNKWFINLCPTTINEPSPAVEHCNELWNTGLESDKTIARQRKRKLNYFANVLIVKDPKNPENEGKVKIYKFGAKIFEKLMAVIDPAAEYGEEPKDPFGFYDGVELKLKLKKKDGFRNLDDSVFVDAGDLFDGDEDKLSELLDNLHDIDALNDPKNFKSYDQLNTELKRVLGEDVASSESPITEKRQEQRKPSNYTSSEDRYKEVETEDKSVPWKESSQSNDDDLDDDLAAFAKLVERD